MPRDDNGTYNLPALVNPVRPGTVITSDWANTTMDDIAAAITDSIAADGQTEALANLPMAGHRHLNVSDAQLRNQYATLKAIQNNTATQLDVTPGTSGDNIVGTLVGWAAGSPGSPGYVQNMLINWIQPLGNTGAVTIQANSFAAKSLVSKSGALLISGDLTAGDTYFAYYNGTQFQLLNDCTTTLASGLSQESITGVLRPGSLTYPAATITGAAQVTIPAGNGWIITPDAAGSSIEDQVSWVQQAVTLTYIATDYCTSIMIDSSGTVVQLNAKPTPQQLRENIYYCDVEHIDGVANTIVMRPAIFGDDTYLARDTTYLSGEQLYSGGKVTGHLATLKLDITDGVLFAPGLDCNDLNDPNFVGFTGASQFTFYPLYGTTLEAPTTTSPVGFYDLAGVKTALGAGKATIHRLYKLGGAYVWAYGQHEYANFATAISQIILDRSNYVTSAKLNSATLICEIVAEQGIADFTDPTKCGFISASGGQFIFGSSNTALQDAPNNANTYGRSGGLWVLIASAVNAVIGDSLTINGATPSFITNLTVGLTNVATWAIKQLTKKWIAFEADSAGDKMYLRSYNPSTEVLRNSTIWDLLTGTWTFPGTVNATGIVTTGNVSVTGNETVSGTLGVTGATTLGSTLSVADTVTAPTVSCTATTAMQLPTGTTLQRPTPSQGMLRMNTDAQYPEYYSPIFGWKLLGYYMPPAFYRSGLTMSNSTVNVSYGLDIAIGSAMSSSATWYMVLNAAMGKLINTPWAVGGTTAAPAGGFPTGITLTTDTFYAVFLLGNSSSGTCDIGFDNNFQATNLMSTAAVIAAGFTFYRRIGWVYYSSAGAIHPFLQSGDRISLLTAPSTVTDNAPTATTLTKTVAAAPRTVGIFGLTLENLNSASTTTAALKLVPTEAPAQVASKSNCDVSVQRYSPYGSWLASTQVTCPVDVNRQLKLCVSQTGNECATKITPQGWIDNFEL